MSASSRPILSLAELRSNDPRAPERGERWRYCCPLPGCGGKRIDAGHRSLSVEPSTGAFYCHRCGGGGRLREFWEESPRLSRQQRARVALHAAARGVRAGGAAPTVRTRAPRRWDGWSAATEASTRPDRPGVRGGVGPVPGRTGAHSASPPAVQATRAAAEAPVGPPEDMGAPEGAALDPRPDLAVDAPLWAVLLRLSADLDGEDPAGVHGALLGARTMGGRLEVGGRTLCLLPPDGVDAAEWTRVVGHHLAAYAGPLRTLLWRAWREVDRAVAGVSPDSFSSEGWCQPVRTAGRRGRI